MKPLDKKKIMVENNQVVFGLEKNHMGNKNSKPFEKEQP